MSDDTIVDTNYTTIKLPENNYRITINGIEKVEFKLPGWPKYRIWRFMQWLVFGFKWEKLWQKFIQITSYLVETWMTGSYLDYSAHRRACRLSARNVIKRKRTLNVEH